jgi:DNA-binding SARP family transcriptional activator
MGDARATGDVAVVLLGGFRILLGGREVPLPEGPQRVVAALALSGRMSRSRLAGTLWPEADERRALARLRTAIWRVNQAVPGLVLASVTAVELDPRAEVDACRPPQDERWAAESPARLLPDWDEDWLVTERERLHQLRLHSLEALAGRLAGEGQFGLAVETALAALRGDPTRESAYRTLMRVHLAEGNLSEARRAYRRCEIVLSRELGVEPDRSTAELLLRAPA